MLRFLSSFRIPALPLAGRESGGATTPDEAEMEKMRFFILAGVNGGEEVFPTFSFEGRW
jgi:hypothetical protein